MSVSDNFKAFRSNYLIPSKWFYRW